ncbi:carbohydrate ABC transporter permease [Bacillota bacterium Meth-B3]|nr:sugar ABC transporter permease [Christensenellaceae bacterium]MEA5067562.1 sugar ABC transporter permease [Christensenellaceae bacterium]
MFKRKKSVLLYLAPGLIGLLVFYLIPFGGGVYHSLTDGGFENKFVGARNYIDIWRNEMFMLGLKNTLELSLMSAPLIFVLAFFVALLLNGLKGQNAFFRNAVLMPYLMPTSAMLLIWLLLFDFGGAVNRLVTALGFERVLWLEGAALRVPVVVMYIWKNLGFSVVIFTAALQSVPEAFYEYARLEGAGFLRRAFSITLPLITPTAFLVLVMAWVNAFKIFKEVYFIGGAYPDYAVYTLQNYMNNMFAKLNYQMVTTAAYSFAAIVLALFGALFLIERRMRKGVSE